MDHTWETVEQSCIQPEFHWDERDVTLCGHFHGVAPTEEAAAVTAEIGWLMLLTKVLGIPVSDL